MLNIKGTLTKNGEIVFQQGKPLYLKALYQEQTPQLSVEITLELTVSVDINNLISGIAGFIWATKDIRQAEIIANALKVQQIDSEIVNVEYDKCVLYLIKVNREENIKEGFDFIQNDVGGLRLKPDWDYSSGERNQSFEQWINE